MTGFESDFDDVDDSPSPDDLWHGMVELSARIDDLATRVLTGPPGPSRGEPAYSSVTDWVEQWLSEHLERDVTSAHTHWCEQWVEHPEAVARLTGLWQRWEELQADWGGMTVWWRDLDSQMQPLMGADGPFRHCRAGETARHRPPASLPVGSLNESARDLGRTSSPPPPQG